MAKIVPDEDAWGPKTPRGKVMDWTRYCDGRSWRLERGVDVDADKSMHSKRSSFRQWAARQGFDMAHVHTSVEHDSVLYIKVDAQAWPDGKAAPIAAGA
jgi:hypothetical protein